jgi:hypothetical protein
VNPLAWLIACVRASNIFILAGQSSKEKLKLMKSMQDST